MSERDEFEAAWRDRYPEHGNSAFRHSEINAHGYANTRVNDGWAMWQAAQCKSWGGWALDGWKLVPAHPTKEMRDAGAKINGQGCDFAHHTWRTMLLHAPAAPQQATTAPTDEQIKELAGMHGGYLDDCDAWSFCGDRGLVRFARSLLAQGWVPVRERLPKVGESVLVAIEFDRPGDWRIKVGGLRNDRTWQVFGASYTPSHWMPLPAAPQPSKEPSRQHYQD